MNPPILISEVLNITQGISKKDFDFIKILIDNNESGVALETLCAIFEQDDLLISKESYLKLVKAADIMNMKLSIPFLNKNGIR